MVMERLCRGYCEGLSVVAKKVCREYRQGPSVAAVRPEHAERKPESPQEHFNDLQSIQNEILALFYCHHGSIAMPRQC